MSETEDRRRFDALLPFYVNGTLAPDDRGWVDAYLARTPGAHAALAWHEALAQALEERHARIPADVGAAALEARLAAARGAGAGRRGSFRDMLERLVPRAAVYPAFAGAAMLVLVQAVAIGVLLTRAEGPEYAEARSVEDVQRAKRPAYLLVNFKPDATEREIRLALIRIGGRIVDGPGQLGDYTLAVAEDGLETARRDLEASGIAETVRRVDAPRARDD
jgi:anti-sigma factor RsiW